MKLYKQTILGLVLCTLISGCLPDNGGSEQAARVETRREAQATGLARSLSVVGSRVFDSFMTNTASPFVQAAAAGGGGVASIPTQMVDFASTFGLSLGPAAAQVQAGYCGDATAGAARSFVVWLSAKDAAGRFSPKGLGDGATGSVMSRLSEMSDPGSVGVAQGTDIALRDGKTMSLGSCSTAFSIPLGSPVMIFANLQEPAHMTSVTTRNESRTVACATGQTGTKTERRTITIQPNGTDDSATAPWTQVIDMCTSAVASLPTIDLSNQGTNILGGAAGVVSSLGSGALKTELDKLANQDCTTAKITKTEINPETGQKVTKTYDTCNDGAQQLATIADLKLDNASLLVENKTLACSTATWGPSGGLSTFVPGIPVALNGQWGAEAWLPNPTGATYIRYSENYDATAPDTSAEKRRLLGKWIGNTLDCKRNENISFSCDDFWPNRYSQMAPQPSRVPSSLSPIKADRLTYARLTRVDGWADPYNQIANPQTHSDWIQTGKSFQESCSWVETQYRFKQCQGNNYNVDNPWKRIHTLTAYGTVSTGDWWQDDELCDCTYNMPGTVEVSCDAVYGSVPGGWSGTTIWNANFNPSGRCGAVDRGSMISACCERNCVWGNKTQPAWGNCTAECGGGDLWRNDPYCDHNQLDYCADENVVYSTHEVCNTGSCGSWVSNTSTCDATACGTTGWYATWYTCSGDICPSWVGPRPADQWFQCSAPACVPETPINVCIANPDDPICGNADGPPGDGGYYGTYCDTNPWDSVCSILVGY